MDTLESRKMKYERSSTFGGSVKGVSVKGSGGSTVGSRFFENDV